METVVTVTILFSKLNEILLENSQTRVNGNKASRRTATVRGEGMRTNFRILYEDLGFRLTDPRNIGTRHIEALCKEWYRKGLAPKTMQDYLSQLRIFCTWIGKKGLVKKIDHYLPDVPKRELRPKSIAEKSKSWAATGVDAGEKYLEATSYDWRFGLMILAQVAFGLRRMEVLQMKPWKCDHGDKFAAYETKGGRPRDIYIVNEVQRAVLDLIKSKIKGKDDTLGWMERVDGKPFKERRRHAGEDPVDSSLVYSEGRYDRLMAKLGITQAISKCTGHGLRAQFAENALLLRDVIPPTLGGTKGQKPRSKIDVVRAQTSELLGHSRPSVTNAYYGSFGREGKPDDPDRAKNVIEVCLGAIRPDQVKEIPKDRLQHCMMLGYELAGIGVYGDPQKVQVLWENHSRRHATDWIAPADEPNLASLEVAAMYLMSEINGVPQSVLA
jgi:integrase